jgi:hypothetical protein
LTILQVGQPTIQLPPNPDFNSLSPEEKDQIYQDLHSQIDSLNLLRKSFADRNYTAMHTHVRRSVHLSALLITWFTWGDGLQRRYASDIAFSIIRFPLTVVNSDMN